LLSSFGLAFSHWFGLVYFGVILVLFLVGVEFFGSYFLVGILFWVVEIV
jgi:hypothetical protein